MRIDVLASAFLVVSATLISACGGAGGAAQPLPPAEPIPSAEPSPSPAPDPIPDPRPEPPPAAWAPQWAEVSAAQLRPGSKIGPSGCTAGFLFVDPVRHTYYLGTAAHCTEPGNGVTADGTGMRVTLDNTDTGQTWGEIGTVVFDSDGPNGVNPGTFRDSGVDFSLIQLDAGINLMANPQVIDQPGPTGFTRCAELVAGDPVGFFGHGDVYEASAINSRSGAVIRCNLPGTADANVEIGIPVSNGDSGGPAINQSSGLAIGHASAGLGTSMTAIPMDLVFSTLAEFGYSDVRLATVDGAHAGP